MCPGCLAHGWRLGIGGFYGETTSKQRLKRAKLSLELGGLFADHNIWSGQNHALSLGAFAGVGRGSLELLDHHSGTLEAALNNPPSILLRRDFIALQLHATLNFELLPWLSVKINAGYLWAFGGRWQQGERELEDPKANFNGYTVQIMFAFSPMR